jgi:hypothetical protein
MCLREFSFITLHLWSTLDVMGRRESEALYADGVNTKEPDGSMGAWV